MQVTKTHLEDVFYLIFYLFSRTQREDMILNSRIKEQKKDINLLSPREAWYEIYLGV